MKLYRANPLEYNTKDRLDYWKKWSVENGYQKNYRRL